MWKPIPGHETYEASSDGRIRNGSTGRILRSSPVNKRSAHQVVGLAGKTQYVHRLVAAAWIGLPNGYNVLHKDGDATNNHVDNLQPVHPRKQRAEVASRHPSGYDWPDRTGGNNGRAKLTAEKARAIRSKANEGASQSAIAQEFGVSQSTVSLIVRGKLWAADA